MAKIKANLRCMDLRGETVTTRWGDVVFSREGLAELEVDEGDLGMLRDMKWLNTPPAPAQEQPEGAEAKSEPGEPAEVDSDGAPKSDTTTEETSPQGGKKHGKGNRR